ncbi:MAG: energy transducer TonB [Planctomycetota bacterium]|nr:energy transducer TonB [Planctomycetota bacterium]MCX8039526.1 energy transducer TonB [Planctomycetota bacterium]MDW8373331.1 energy transducer TonB [Planctomycetota bacterium]
MSARSASGARTGWRAWSWAVLASMALNLALVIALAAVSQVPPAFSPALPTLRWQHRELAPATPTPAPAARGSESGDSAAARGPAAVSWQQAPPLALPPLPPLPPLPASVAPPLAERGSWPAPGEGGDRAWLRELSPLAPTWGVDGTRDALPAASALTERPAQRLGDPDLARFYPRLARLRGISGTTRLRCHIDEAGQVTAVEVLDSEPPGVFEDAAARLGRALRYRPAERAGRPVPSVEEVLIRWVLQ